MDTFLTQSNCDRCNGDLKVRTMSWFNDQTICIDCSTKEKALKKKLREAGEDIRHYEGCGYIPNA